MGNLNVCERKECNALIKGNAAGIVDYWTSLDGTLAHMTLCPACVADLVALLDSEPITPRKRAYDKPYTPVSNEDSLTGASNEQVAAELFQRMMRQAALEAGNSESS